MSTSETDPSHFGRSSSTTEAATEATSAVEDVASSTDSERQPELEPGGRHAVAEGHADPVSSIDVVWDALTKTSPNTPLEQVESPWQPERGGMARIYRGIKKMTGTDALPAWADVAIGVGEFFASQQNAQGGESSQQEAASASTEVEIS